MVQIILTILSSAVKFAMTFPLAVMQFRFSFFETLLWTNVGGILGIYFFAFLSEKLIAWWNRACELGGANRVCRLGGANRTFRKRRYDTGYRTRDKKIFTKKNRRIIHIKQRYGLAGIAITTPFLLSIPLGTFLVVRYYRSRKVKFTYLIVSNLVWSVIYTIFYMFWDGLLFKRG